MISKELNVGRAGEYIVLADLLLKGVQAFDTGQGVGYDLIADLGGEIIRIQVKTTQKKRKVGKNEGVYFFHLKRAGKKGTKFYNEKDFDCFALVALDIRKVFYIKNSKNIPQHSISIRDKNTEYKAQAKGGSKNGLYYQDLTWEAFLGE